MNNREKAPLELYVHIPFCIKKCDYCDFLSGPAGREVQKRYVKALLEEIAGVSGFSERKISSVFIGGGTPSVLEASETAEIMDALRGKFRISSRTEITMEVNPGTLTKEKLEQYKVSGINRLSMGLQSTENSELKILGRIHTFEEFLDNYRLARDIGFNNINVDLMFAIPGQSCESWEKNLRTVAELEPEHISAYSLIIEKGTPFAERNLELPDEDSEYRMYEDTAAILESYGYHQYEISNYAKTGFECRHNIGYWKRTEYLGMGLGAASLVSEGDRQCRFNNTGEMQEYFSASRSPENIRKEKIFLSAAERQEEFMFLGLRMTEGISEKDFLSCFGVPAEEIYGQVLEKYRKMGFLEKKGCFWRFTRQGIHVSNHILAEFLQE